MKAIQSFVCLFFCCATMLYAQPSSESLDVIKKTDHTPVKNQANTGTCWSFSNNLFA